eukprot:CAMPEP_0185732632 /NCGR_PEP_ID=MMETSP1171-20130828/16929_1 /TAXON_ID=374046 /ORGANISM="Helicotheca tamensis, Strain CCMP826" /LENGTH=334 /DNA_ID=CAMNT_0028402171 /DNA_START=32 /DNA_END=1036 /DNA_ORIENTATION=+
MSIHHIVLKYRLHILFSVLGFTLLFLNHSNNNNNNVAISSSDKLLPTQTALRNVKEPIDTETDRAIFWHIPKSGGTTLKWYYGCLGLVIANEVSVSNGHDTDESLQVWEHANGFKYVNADTTGLNGIDRAKSLGLGESGLADVMFTMFPHQISELLFPSGSKYKGRFFTMIRHPIERSASMFYYRRVAKHENENVYLPHLKNIDLATYLKRGGGDRNFMVSLLVNKLGGQVLTVEDLNTAKDMLRTKFLVGLTSKFEESVERFDHYFGYDRNGISTECKESLYPGKNRYGIPTDPIEEGSEEWDLLMDLNDLDIQLYEYAVELFDQQRRLSRLK